MSRIIILIIIVVILLAYLYCLKKDIRQISRQLNDYNELKTRKKIDINLFDKDIEKLAEDINKHIDAHIKMKIDQINAEKEMKRSMANISHDIRTPLTSIKGYIQMANKADIDEDMREEYLSIAEKKSENLKDILEKFFELSIVQSPEYSLDIEYVNLNEVLYESLGEIYTDFKTRLIEPVIDIKQENIIVLGNKIGINRVIENLFTNLIKYSKGEEGILLYIEDKKAILNIYNKVDNISEEELGLLFDRFYKKDISRNSSESSGLGLAINKKLMEHMNGDIVVSLESDIITFRCSWDLVEI